MSRLLGAWGSWSGKTTVLSGCAVWGKPLCLTVLRARCCAGDDDPAKGSRARLPPRRQEPRHGGGRAGALPTARAEHCEGPSFPRHTHTPPAPSRFAASATQPASGLAPPAPWLNSASAHVTRHLLWRAITCKDSRPPLRSQPHISYFQRPDASPYFSSIWPGRRRPTTSHAGGQVSRNVAAGASYLLLPHAAAGTAAQKGYAASMTSCVVNVVLPSGQPSRSLARGCVQVAVYLDEYHRSFIQGQSTT